MKEVESRVVKPAVCSGENSGILACRTCLNTDIILYDISAIELVEILSEFTGNPVFPSDGYPQYICKLCLYLLRKFVKFRHRYIKAMYLLQQLKAEVGVITTESIKVLDRDKLKDNLIKTEVKTIDILENIIPSVDVKIEILNPAPNTTGNLNNIPQTEIPNKYILINTDKIIEDLDKINQDSDDFDDLMDVPLIEMKNCLVETSKQTTPKKEPRKRKSPEITKNLRTKKKKEDQTLQNSAQDVEHMSEACKKRIEEIKRDIADGKVKSSELISYEEYVQKLQKLAEDYNLKVTFLTKEEQINVLEEKRTSEQFKNAKYKCEVCCQIFQRAVVLENHAVSHSESRGKHSCDICRSRFMSTGRLRLHYSTRHTADVYCNTCGRKLYGVWNTEKDKVLKEHYEWHQGNHKLIKCEQCNIQFTLKKQYYMHVTQKHGGHADGPECLICDDGRSFLNHSGLWIHYTKSHRTNPRCSSCKVVFADSDALTVHGNASGGCQQGYSSCPKCGNNFTNESEMKTHFNEVHRKNYFKCSQCPRQFKEKKKYERHIKNHKNKIKTDTETLVTASLRYNSLLASRMNGETKPVQKAALEKIICEVCGVLHLKMSHLQHMRLHTGEKPHQCEFCDKRFRLKNGLQQHLATHTGQKRYKCHICSKAFRQYTHRTYHMVTHTKEKPYECLHCGKRFGFNENMKEHVRTVHEGLPPRRKNRVRRGKEDSATNQWTTNQIEDTTE